MDFIETCCVCLQRNYNTLKHLTEYDEDNRQFSEKIKKCAPNQQWHIDYKICLKCVNQLKAAYEFILNCENNEVDRQLMYDKFYRKTLFTSEAIKSDSDTFDDNIPLIHMLDDVKHDSSGPEDCKERLESVKQKFNKKINRSTKKRKKCKIEKCVSESFTCYQCNMILKNKRSLLRHIQTKHRDVNEKPHNCDICGVGYRCYSSFLVHKRWHNDERPYICSFCGKGFRCMKTLKSHQERHGTVRAYKCDQCEKTFKTASNLRTHKHVVHTDPENFKHICSECGKKCPSKSHLDSHLKRNHNGSKDFACHICEKRFLFNHEVQLHIRCTHRQERAYSCGLCDKSYKGLSSLKKHAKRTHNVGNFESKPPEKKHLCPYCPKVFSFNNKLQRHILSHTGEKPFKCDICTDHKGFKERYELKAHKRNDHGIHDLA